MKRESFGSRIGFLLVSAGCAIGIGNVWKFPYLCGQNGGGIFVVFYLLFLIIMGIPVLTMELGVGRASRASCVQAYKKLEPNGSKWHIHGYVCIIGCVMLMMYYTSVSGWMLDYFVKFIQGTFNSISIDQVSDVFSAMLANPIEQLVFMGITVAAGFLVCSLGLEKGLEKISVVMMTALFALIVVLAVHSCFLKGGLAGLEFYLLPSIDRVKESGLWHVIVNAMNQSFFTLSLGIAAMEIFGSYMSKEKTLVREATTICCLDTFVALMSGLIIFPACFAYGVNPDAGPSLIFITLPRVFMNMPFGQLWGALFFLFMTFASFSTVIAVFENIISTTMENFNLERKKAVLIDNALIFVLSIPCALGYSVLSNVHLIGGRDILDSEDFIVSNLLLPIGSLIYLLFCVTKWGWGFENYAIECNTGEGTKISMKLRPYFQYILPILILVILVTGLI